MQLKWNRALFSLPARLCVCIGVCIYSSHLWGRWNGGCHSAFQTSTAPPLTWCFHKSGPKNAPFLQWVTPTPIRPGSGAETASFRAVSRTWKWGCEIRVLSTFLKQRWERGTTCQHKGASAFPFPPFTGHECAKGARWVTDLLHSTLLSPGRAGQHTADAHTLVIHSYHSR